jgi:Flp pilus assembly protein TadB
MEKGLLCGLIDDYPSFDYSCEKYVRDEKKWEEEELNRKIREEEELYENTGGLSTVGIKSSLVAGIIIMALAVLLQVALLSINRISLWLILLFIGGVVLTVKGAVMDTRKRKKKAMSRQLLDQFED